MYRSAKQEKISTEFTNLNIPGAGTWIRDCELYAFNKYTRLSLEFNKESDGTKWKITFDGYIAFKVTSHEFMVHLILLDALPDEGAFFIYNKSPWVQELKKVDKPEILDSCKHFVLFFYEEVVEVISKGYQYEKIN